jgi:hypothetical protein
LKSLSLTIRGNPWILGAGTALYLVFSIALALTKSPGNDEGWFAAPAHNLAKEGSLAMPVLEPTGSWLRADLTGIRRHTYWNMPLCMVVHGAWFRLAGFGLRSMRMLSILLGLIVLGSWYVIILVLTRDRVAAYLGFLFLALDYTFLWGAADGRPDLLCLAMGSLAVASYLMLRQRDLLAAILVSNTFAAAGLYTHPNGVLAMAALAFLTLYFDVRQLRMRHLIAAVPYLIGALGWIAYISQDPTSFLAQFAANASAGSGTRWSGFTEPLRTLREELLLRYLAHFGWLTVWTDATSKWNALIPVVYFASLISAAFSGICRDRGNRALVIMAALCFMILTANGLKLQFYLVYVMPLYAAVLGLWARYMSQRPAIVFVPVLLAPWLFLQSTSIMQLIRGDTYHRSYLPAMEYVKRQIQPNSVVIGNTTAAFALGFDHLVDDERLGYFSSVRPDIVIADRFYPRFWAGFRRDQPEAEQYIALQLGTYYDRKFENQYYTIYQRRTVSSFSGSAVRMAKMNRLPSGETE